MGPRAPGFGNGDSPYGTSSYGLGGQADLQSMGAPASAEGIRVRSRALLRRLRSATRRSLRAPRRCESGPGANPLAQLNLLGAKATTALPGGLVAGLNSGPRR
jgi:hypothetical protein